MMFFKTDLSKSFQQFNDHVIIYVSEEDEEVCSFQTKVQAW